MAVVNFETRVSFIHSSLAEEGPLVPVPFTWERLTNLCGKNSVAITLLSLPTHSLLASAQAATAPVSIHPSRSTAQFSSLNSGLSSRSATMQEGKNQQRGTNLKETLILPRIPIEEVKPPRQLNPSSQSPFSSFVSQPLDRVARLKKYRTISAQYRRSLNQFPSLPSACTFTVNATQSSEDDDSDTTMMTDAITIHCLNANLTAIPLISTPGNVFHM